MGQTRTLAELQQHVEALQKEKKVLQANVAQHKAAADRAALARQEAQSLLTALKVIVRIYALNCSATVTKTLSCTSLIVLAYFNHSYCNVLGE